MQSVHHCRLPIAKAETPTLQILPYFLRKQSSEYSTDMGPVHTEDDPIYIELTTYHRFCGTLQATSLLIHLQQQLLHAGVGLHLRNSARDGAAHAL